MGSFTLESPDVFRAAPHPLVILGIFVLLALAWLWPLPLVISSRVAFDPGDPLLNAWILWWNAQAVPFSAGWWSPPIFHPMPGALALSEHLAGIALVTTPLVAAGGSPALAYNVALLLSTVLSGFFTYLLVLRLTGSAAAAFCAGIAFAFAPYRASQLSHLQVLTTQWLPLQLLGLHAYLETARARWLGVFGVAWILQAWSNGYYLLFAVPLVGLWLLWFVVAACRWRDALAIVAAWGAAWLVLLPSLLTYKRVHETLGLSRSRGEMSMFSADLSSFLNRSDMLVLWPPGSGRSSEDDLFPGLTVVLVLLLTGARLVWRPVGPRPPARPRVFAFYALGAVAMAALAFGPAAPDAGAAAWLKPYEWLVHLPGFDGLRVPARFAMLMALCLAVAAGAGLALLLPSGPRARGALAAIVAAALAADGWIGPVGASPPPGRLALPSVQVAAVLEVPPDSTAVNLGAMWRAMSHRLPVVNGYSGHIPPHQHVLASSLRREDPTALLELARGGALLVAVSDRHDPGGHFRRFVESFPGIRRQQATSAGMTYVLPAQPRVFRPQGGAAYAFDVTPLPRRHVILDLGAERVIRSVELPLGERFPDLDGRFAIEASADGESWETVWEDWTGGPVMAAVLENPRLIPVRLTLPDVSARYLRLHPVDEWLVQALAVRGP